MTRNEKIIYSFAEKLGTLSALVEVCPNQPDGFAVALSNAVEDLEDLKREVFESLYIILDDGSEVKK